ncbi:MAG: hypothetical protein M1832_004969 [Thelocarpon impressellum]|nr:MAG: hypothetical protein M1832_004969 [Thelocarpon impressellum]
MPLFLNPLAKHDVSDFSNVLVPLADAPRHPSVVDKDSKLGKEASAPRADDGENGEQRAYSAFTLEGLRAEIDDDLAASGVNSSYDRKSKIINKAIQDIGMGTYNWQLFVLCGFGWFADNFWLQGLALTLTPISYEFGISETSVRYTTCATFIGLCIGACFWGVASDVIGRRLAFNATLFLAGVFGLAVGGAPTWIGVCALYACLGIGVGGNLPVDGALFLEFLPFASGNLLTLLSVWWPIGQLVASLIAWGLIPNNECSSKLPSCNKSLPGVECCGKSNNMGWRYFTLTLGAITFLMFICRFFLFHLFESPKYLLSRGRQQEAVATVHGMAYKNKKKTWLTNDILNEIGGDPEVVAETKLSTIQIIKLKLATFSTDRIGPLFATRKLAITTSLVWFCWTTIGMGYPLFNAFLPQYLANNGASSEPTPQNIVYRNYAITSIVGVPGSIIACYTVDIKYVGRKGTMAISTLLSGIFLFLFTISSNSDVQLTFTCLEAFFQNIMYGVLTPEVFPAPNRGTGTGIASFLNRIAGLCAPIIGANAGTANPAVPIYVAGALFLSAFIAMVLLPIETMGRQSL